MKWSIRRRRLFGLLGRGACGFAIACAAGACSSEGSDLVSLYTIMRQTVGSNQRMVTLQDAAAVPYASIGIRLGDSPQTMIILASDSGGEQLWTSAARIAIVTRNGRIVRTAGFEHNLGVYVSQNTTLDGNDRQTVRWQADFPDLGLYSVPIKCEDRPTGEQVITILGKGIHTKRIEETCTSTVGSLDWSFKNTYWVDPDNNLVWRSIQHVHPDLDAIETEILRPPQ